MRAPLGKGPQAPEAGDRLSVPPPLWLRGHLPALTTPPTPPAPCLAPGGLLWNSAGHHRACHLLRLEVGAWQGGGQDSWDGAQDTGCTFILDTQLVGRRGTSPGSIAFWSSDLGRSFIFLISKMGEREGARPLHLGSPIAIPGNLEGPLLRCPCLVSPCVLALPSPSSPPSYLPPGTQDSKNFLEFLYARDSPCLLLGRECFVPGDGSQHVAASPQAGREGRLPAEPLSPGPQQGAPSRGACVSSCRGMWGWVGSPEADLRPPGLRAQASLSQPRRPSCAGGGWNATRKGTPRRTRGQMLRA